MLTLSHLISGTIVRIVSIDFLHFYFPFEVCSFFPVAIYSVEININCQIFYNQKLSLTCVQVDSRLFCVCFCL